MLQHYQYDQDQRPVSYAQQRLWLLDRLDLGNPSYTIARAIRMRGTLSLAALQETLRSIVARHESLRTTFTKVEGEPFQIIASSLDLETSLIDLSYLEEAAREVETLRLARDEAQRPFDLTRGPLLRTTLLRLHPEEHVLVLVMHHIITDAWSISLLFEEIGKLYEAFVNGQASPLPDLLIQYGNFARWQRETLQDEIDKQLPYWRQQLAGALSKNGCYQPSCEKDWKR